MYLVDNYKSALTTCSFFIIHLAQLNISIILKNAFCLFIKKKKIKVIYLNIFFKRHTHTHSHTI